MNMPSVSRIRLYPIKSLDGFDVSSAAIVTRGALIFDRRWAIVDAMGELINAKRTPLVQKLRAEFQLDPLRVRFNGTKSSTSWLELAADLPQVASFLSNELGFDVALVENEEGGFPDDPEASGPTIVAVETLQLVSQWFGIDEAECRRRFRANVEVTAGEAFWEDRLYGPTEPRRFDVGAVRFLGQNPCVRCVVPTRDSRTGEVMPGFAKTFQLRREETLPSWAARERFVPYYRLTVNTRVFEEDWGSSIQVGDAVTLDSDS